MSNSSIKTCDCTQVIEIPVEGLRGPAGKSMEFKGEYSATTVYAKGDLVRETTPLVTSIFVSKTDNNGGNPLTDPFYWEFMFDNQGSSTAAWGTITGNIANQADLQAALLAKQDKLIAGANITIVGNVISATGGGGGATWGSITGTLSNQTDLQNELNALKLPSQSGEAGKFLKTDGTTTSWAVINNLPDQSGHEGEFLTTDGTNASWTGIGCECEEVIWDAPSDIPAGTEVTIPNPNFSYIVGSKSMLVSVNGLMLYRGRKFLEVGETGAVSNKVKFLFDVNEGADIAVWTVNFVKKASGITARVQLLENKMVTAVGSATYHVIPNPPEISGTGTVVQRIQALENLGNYLTVNAVFTTTTPLPPISGSGDAEQRVTVLETWFTEFDSRVSYRKEP